MTSLAREDMQHEGFSADPNISNILLAANIAYARVDANHIIQHVDGDAAGILGLTSNDNLIGSKLTDMFGEYKIEDPIDGIVFTSEQVENLIVESLNEPEPHRTSVVLTTLDGRRVRVNTWYDGLNGCTMPDFGLWISNQENLLILPP